MYTILVTDDNELVVTIKERIMQRSKLVDTLHFLVPVNYKDKDMSAFTCLMEYRLPISKEYHSEILNLSDELYKDRLEYKVPFDTSLTKEHGDIEIQLSFIKTELDTTGKSKQLVRKTSPATITIIPIAAWSDVIADDALNSIDQRIIQTQSMINALEELSQQLMDNYDKKADNLVYEKNKLQLTSGGNRIGDEVEITPQETTPDGNNMEVVYF